MFDRDAQRSRELFESGLYCAESVLLAIAENKGIHSEWIPKIATGFCSGLARTCGTCGAVSGAVMGINLVAGRNTPEEPLDGDYAAVCQFLEGFENRFGSINCLQLTGCDLGTPEGQASFQAKHVIERCNDYVEEATRLALSIIENIS